MRESLEQLVARVNANAYLPTSGVRSMARQVKLPKGKEFTFSTGGGGVASKYPWDEWFNGNLLLLERSEGDEDAKGAVVNITTKKDYDVATDAMPAKLKTAARRRYKVVQISRKDADGQRLTDALIIRARDMDTAERDAEDIQRAEEKEAFKAKKLAKKATAPTTDQSAA